MRVLLTGATGFVGPYVADALARLDTPVEIVATARNAVRHARLGDVAPLDLTKPDEIADALARHQPTHVVNLAGIAAPAEANAEARETWRVHVDAVIELARAILHSGTDCTLVNVGSGLVYGGTAAKVCPLGEDALLDPRDEYAATKAAADLALGALAHRGLKCVRMRPFNHTGRGQTTDFAVPAFAMQIARIEAGLEPPIVRVGNLDAERDFLDVRDVARAYALVVRNSASLAPGTILNVASGVPRRMSAILDALIAMSRVSIRIERDPGRLRPVDLARIVGNAEKARLRLGWAPVHAFEDTLSSVLEGCREQVPSRR